MEITLEKIGKKFNREWIFRNIDLEIKSGEKWAITGENGSGKSTLLKIISTYALSTEGQISFKENNQNIESSEIQLSCAYVAPYFNLLEEYTLDEFLHFHGQFKKPKVSISEMVTTLGLYKAKNKYIKDFSSGMKQRVKLITAFGFHNKIVFLDEPTNTLDQKGIDWFRNEIKNIENDSIIIMGSNLKHEIDLVDEKISIKKFR